MKYTLPLLLYCLFAHLAGAQPVISNVSPATGSSVNTSGNVTFSCTVTGTYAISKVTFSIPMGYDVANDNPLFLWSGTAANTSGSTWSITWTGANIPVGNYSVVVQALDSHGGTSGVTIQNVSVANVSIGTSDPKGYMLAVNGSMICTNAYVKLQTNWPDYVFDKAYQLTSLDSVESYVQCHQHLPEMPSANEVDKDGIDLGKNQAAMLKKIEELTLYLIDANKRIARLERQLKARR